MLQRFPSLPCLPTLEELGGSQVLTQARIGDHVASDNYSPVGSQKYIQNKILQHLFPTIVLDEKINPRFMLIMDKETIRNHSKTRWTRIPIQS